MEIISHYPEIVKACESQKIPLSKAFGKLEDTDGNGQIDHASYPFVKCVDGKIPLDIEGNIAYDAGRLKAAGSYAKMYDEDAVLKSIVKVKAIIGF